MINFNKYSKGFSLIEVLVFTAVLGLFFVAALSVATFNIRNMKIQEHKILATRYAEEATEWLKQEKEDDWTMLVAHNAGFYCLNSLNWTTYSVTSPACALDNYISTTPFKRELSLTKPQPDQVSAIVTVTWKDMNTDLDVEIKTVFKLLE